MNERTLFSSPLIAVTEFELPPGDEAWRAPNHIESRSPLVVFPRHPVGVRTAGTRILATPNLAMFYNPDQEFERELRDAKGDACIFFTLHDRALDELERSPTVIAERRMSATHAPSTRAVYLKQHLLGRYLQRPVVDALRAEEEAMAVVGAVVELRPAVRGRRRATKTAHAELAEAAKDLIVQTVSESLSLDEVASRLRVSPFHLARVFRAETGFSLHQYRKQLRLRLALERLREGAQSLTALAFELGFASHSHFTDAFRAEFGVAPSTLREAV
jgi:AraC-like DNA-binding protein